MFNRFHVKLAKFVQTIHKASLNTEAPTIHQTITGRKRFYKHVHIETAKSSEKNYQILLDGKVLKTPARNELCLPTRELAACIALEWDAQHGDRGILPSSMPLMTLACTAIDQVMVNSTLTKQTCLKYLPTDTALIFASEDNRILLKNQRQHFLPIIRWIQQKYGVTLDVSQDVSTKIHHSHDTIVKFSRILDSMDAFTLTCLQSATMEFKSLILALAFLCRYDSYVSHYLSIISRLMNRRIELQDGKTMSRLEEEFQVEIWGLVEGGHDLDRLNNSVSLSAINTFMGLLYSHSELHNLTKKWESV